MTQGYTQWFECRTRSLSHWLQNWSLWSVRTQDVIYCFLIYHTTNINKQFPTWTYFFAVQSSQTQQLQQQKQQQQHQQQQQQQQQPASNQSLIIPLPVNLPGQTNFGPNVPIESPALLVNIPVTSPSLNNLLVTSSIPTPPSPGR